MKPDYCTQNDGKCEICSLSNYGRDCKNIKIDRNVITYAEFCEWHSPDGVVSETKLRDAYEVYKYIYEEHGKAVADDEICGHPVWDTQDDYWYTDEEIEQSR